jgi:hypothetical protein
MRKTLPALLTVLAIALGACSGTTGSTTATQAASQVQSSSGDSAAVALSTSYDNALPVASQFLLGTFKLEGTDQAVTAAQAAVLLPLWTEYSDSNQSMGPGSGQTGTTSDNTDVQAQIDALVAQIQAAMTSDQTQAIADLQLTSDSAQTILSDLGITISAPGQNAGGQQPPAMSGGNGQQPQGAPPAGLPPSGGQQPRGTPPAGAGQAPEDTPPAPPSGGQPSANGQMPNAQPSGLGAGFGFPPDVTIALIQLLQERSGVPTTTAAEASSSAAPSRAPGGSSSSKSVTLSGAYTLDSGSTTLDGPSPPPTTTKRRST